MCQICKKFKRGSISLSEAREELEEQAEFLTEDHIEDIEEMLSEAEDTYDYITERKKPVKDYEDIEESYDNEEDELPNFDDQYNLDDGEDN